MAADRLKAHIQALQQALAEEQGPLNPDEREQLEQLTASLEGRLLALDNAEADSEPTLVDGVNLMAEEFEARHPTLAGTLRSVMQTLSDMGI